MESQSPTPGGDQRAPVAPSGRNGLTFGRAAMIICQKHHNYPAAFLLFALCWMTLSSPWLDGTVTIPYDAKAHFQAQLQFLATALHTGQSPFWTPNVFGGSPQIADPQSLIFSPAIVIAYLFPQPSLVVLDAYVLALLGSAGASVILFFRDRGWHPIGAMIAALGYSFGASAAWRIQHVGQIQSYAMFAMTLWLLARAIDRHSILSGVLAGLSAGLMMAEPDQVALLAAYILVAYVVAHIVRQPRPLLNARHLAPVLISGAIAGIFVAALPLALTYLFVAETSRPQIDLVEAVRGSLHPASLLTAAIGDLYGAMDPHVEYWGPYSTSWNPNELTLSQNMSQLYVGALPLVLLVGVGLTRRIAWSREIMFFTVALVIMTAYALGGFTPLYALFYWAIPGVSFFRRPADATFLVGGLMAIVSGYLAHRVAAGPAPQKLGRPHATEACLFISLFALALAITIWMGHVSDATKPIVVAAIGLIVARILVHFIERRGGQSVLACLTAVAAAMTLDLRINNGPNESTGLSVNRYDFMNPNCQNTTIRFLKAQLDQPPLSPRRDRVELVGLGFSWPNLGLIHGFDHVLGYNPLRMEVVSKAIGASDSIAGWEQRQFTPLFSSYRSTFADMLGLRYIAAPVPIEQVDKRLLPGDLNLIARTAEAFVYENTRAFPRVMFVSDWGLADFDQLVETGKWPPFDPRKTVLLDREPSGPTLQPTLLANHPSEVLLAKYENTVVEVEVTTNQAGFVVQNSAWHPWWRATVDDKPVEILKANVMFRAVQVPAGKHRVRFVFEPISGALAELSRPRPKTTTISGTKRAAKRPKA